ncbi:MAG TPA: hypothetical protein VIY08_10420 [Candidatus Nitrosocosmicus sp.]
MTSIDNIPTNHNKDYDHADDDECCFPEHLVDNTFNDLMDADKKHNKYIHQAFSKFKDLRRNSQVTFFDIFKDDLSNETKKHLNDYIKDCSSSKSKIYQKLNGIITEVIYLIYKQAEFLIISSIEYEDIVWVKKTINEIRNLIRKRWRLVKADVN